MAKRQAKKVYPTMKIEPQGELDIGFTKCQCSIVSMQDVETKKYGTKTTLTLNNDDLGTFQIFVNNYSMQNLIDAFGEEDSAYIGKIVNLTKQEDKTYEQEMIVVTTL